MSRCAALVLVVAGLASCLPTPEHRCSGAEDCAGGTCVEPAGACAFPDPGCKSSLRYGDGAGALAGTCVAAEVDAGIDAAPDFDEDGDGVADRLDNCPHVANANQADTSEGLSADGVGDACDPEPFARNQLLLFDGFSAGTGSWLASGAMLGGGVARLAQGGYLAASQPLSSHVELQVAGRGTGPGATALSVGAGLQLTMPLVGAECSQVSTPVPLLRMHTGDNMGVTNQSTLLAAGTTFALAITTDDSQWTCRLEVGASRRQLRHAALGMLSATGYVGVAADAPVELDYVVVIGMSTP